MAARHLLLLLLLTLAVASSTGQDAMTLYNQGTEALMSGRLKLAVKLYRACLRLDSKYPDVNTNMATALKALGLVEHARRALDAAVLLQPDDHLAVSQKHVVELELAHWQHRRSARTWVQHTVQDWSKFQLDDNRPFPVASIDLAHALSLHRLALKAARAEAAEAFGGLAHPRRHKRPLAVRPGARLNIGYVSSDLREHAVGFAMLSVLIDQIQFSSKFAVTLYSLQRSPNDSVRGPLGSRCLDLGEHGAAAAQWRDLDQLSVEDAADLVQSDQIHMLFNLNGNTDGHRNELFALQPAPIQAVLVGPHDSLAMATVPYFVADGLSFSVSTSQEFFSEKLALLPWTFHPTSHKSLIPLKKGRKPQQHQQQPYFVLGTLNRLVKLDPTMLSTWTNAINRLEQDAKFAFSASAGRGVPLQLIQELIARGVDPSVALLPPFTKVQSLQEHVHRVEAQIDLSLDTQSVSGFMTALDSLWGSVPLLTVSGETVANRFGACALTLLQLDAGIVRDLKSYEDTLFGLVEG